MHFENLRQACVLVFSTQTQARERGCPRLEVGIFHHCWLRRDALWETLAVPSPHQSPCDAYLTGRAKRAHFQERWSRLGWQQTWSWSRAWAAIGDGEQKEDRGAETVQLKDRRAQLQSKCQPAKLGNSQKTGRRIWPWTRGATLPIYSLFLPVLPTAAHPAQAHLFTASMLLARRRQGNKPPKTGRFQLPVNTC